jgi:flavin-dependent dehydrogenase
MLKCDVLVVGAGASGSTASLLLSKAGFDVITVDKASRIGGFTNPKIDITESELPDGSKLGPILKELQIKPLKRFNESVWHSRNESFTLKSDVYDFYFKRGPTKDSLDFQLMKKALNKGCEFLPKTEVIKFNFNNGVIDEVILRNKRKKISINPKIVVAADGSFSKCRKLAGIREDSYYLEGFGARFKSKIFQKTQVIFDSEFAPGGYIYAGSVNNESFVGVVIDSQITKKSSKEFFSLNKKRNAFFKNFEEVKALNFFGGKGKYGIVEKLVRNNLILVGGAGFLIDPFMGYGVNHAIFSGYKASCTIKKSLTNEKSLEVYETFYRNNFLQYFNYAMKSRKNFKKLDNKDLDFVIRSLRYISEKNVEGIKAYLEIIKAKPTSIRALNTLYTFSKIFF